MPEGWSLEEHFYPFVGDKICRSIASHIAGGILPRRGFQLFGIDLMLVKPTDRVPLGLNPYPDIYLLEVNLRPKLDIPDQVSIDFKNAVKAIVDDVIEKVEVHHKTGAAKPREREAGRESLAEEYTKKVSPILAKQTPGSKGPAELREGDIIFLKGGAWQGKPGGWRCIYLSDLGEDHVRVEYMGQTYKERREYLFTPQGSKPDTKASKLDTLLNQYFSSSSGESSALDQAGEMSTERRNRFITLDLRSNDIDLFSQPSGL